MYEDLEIAWQKAQKGDGLTDQELDNLVEFFKDLVAKLEVLGPRWSLATDVARQRYDRHSQDQYWRNQQKRWEKERLI